MGHFLWKCAAAVALFAFAVPALAHAFLDHAQPAVGAKIAASPTEVRIWFTEEIEPAFSTIEVQDSTGKQVDKKDSHRDDKDHKLLSVSVPALGPGAYKVIWQVVATDTHKTNGDFSFTVAP